MSAGHCPQGQALTQVSGVTGEPPRLGGLGVKGRATACVKLQEDQGRSREGTM